MLLAVVGLSRVPAAELLVGAATVSITPNMPVELAGLYAP